MTATMRADSRTMYSWWWDSHICPKNSKWLHENLTDMDAKVKQMIKLIEEDADSFAMRAEMYYKKRPELMKLVEEFYRAYRALAERYDHATVVIRQAHRTIAEAYPNQLPILLSDDSSQTDAHLLQTTPPASMMFRLDDSETTREGMNELGESYGYEETTNQVHDLGSSEAEQVDKAEIEISSSFKQVLSKLEDENDVINVERLSNLESEVFQAQENFRFLNEQAIKAQGEVQTLKVSITKLETEREVILLQYHKCLENISSLEKNISCVQKEYGELMDRACRTEIEVESLKEDIARVEAEKEAALVLSSTMVSNLEKKLRHETENAESCKEQADRAGIEVLALKESLTRYQECLENITSLEQQISVTRDEAKWLHNEIEEGVAKLKGTEEKCQLLERSNQSLQSELGLTLQKMRLQSEELAEKQKETSTLWTCIEEECLRHLETQSSFQTLRNSHSQAQGDLISMASEIHSKTQNLKEMETQTKALENAVEKVEEEKKSLKELYLSSVISTNNLEVEISSLKERTKRVEAEIELHLDQRHALQEEVYFLEKELAGLNDKNRALLEQVESVGFNPECFGSSVKVLQNENSKLREISEMDKNERTALLEKMKIMGELLDKNEFLEISVSSLHAELEGVREKVEMLEDSCQSLLREKRNLVAERTSLTSQLQSVSENYINLSEKNMFLENSLSDAIKELKEMTVKSNCLEETCFLLNRDNSRMISEREKLESQLEISMKTVEDQQKRYAELKENHFGLKENHFGLIREREYALCEVEELQNLWEATKQEHDSLNQLAQTNLSQVCQLQEEGDIRRKELEDEFEKAITANLEIFILQSCLRDAAKYNFSRKLTSERLLDGSKDSATFISDLRLENIKRQVEVQALFDQVKTLRMGMDHMLETLQINEDHGHEDKSDLDQRNVHDIVIEPENTQHSLSKCRYENQQLVIEKMVIIELLRQLQSEAANLVVKGDTLGELRSKNQKVLQLNEKLRLKFLESRHKERDLRAEIESVSRKLLETQQTMRLILSERTELCKMMERLTSQYDEVKASQENQGKLIVRLSGVSDNQVKETGYLSELKTKFEIILNKLVEEVEQYKSRVERLSYRLQKKRNEVDMLETQAAVSFERLQISAVREAFFEGKFFELIEAYEKLQNSKEKENMMLKEENSKLVFENDRQRSQLASYIPHLICLKDSLYSLEENVALPKKVDKDDKQKTECVILASHLCGEKFPQFNDNQRDIMVDLSAELCDVQKRIHLVDLAVLEKMNANASLEMGMKEIEEIKSRSSSSRRENRQSIKHPSSQQEESKRGRLRRPKSEISEEGSDILMKDITLDQISKSPSGRITRRQIIEADRHMLELWESTNKDGSIDLTVGNSKRLPTLSTDRYQNEAVKELKGGHASINALIEKELHVNKLETSKRVSEPRHERNRKKIVERLDTDAQRLTNLQITLQDLKKTVEINEKTKKTKCVENDDAKRQLEEADAAILKLFDLNCKLKKSAEGRSMAMDGFSMQGADGSASVRNRIVSAQARRGSEKIGQLQSEVQKLQFLLLKMEDEKVNRSRIRVTERTQRVLLKDYLYGGKRTPAPHKQKKPPFCGCVQTPSRGEWSN